MWSTCDDWLNYPSLTGRKKLVDSTEWGEGDIEKHHVWWFGHLPKASGKTGDKYNNWWLYVVDFNRYVIGESNARADQVPTKPAVITPTNGVAIQP